MNLKLDIRKRLQGFELDVKFDSSASITGILGASGSGKSMTLKCIAGIEDPDSGEIVINDRTVYDSNNRINIKTRNRGIGYLFQNYALFPNMTVSQNILSGVRDKSKHNNILREMIKLFRLSGLEDRKPSQISGGQQQRVALARIFASDPEILMLDEPFSALDSTLKEHIQLELLDILEKFNKKIIIVTHSRDEIFRFCEDVVIVHNGKSIRHSNVKDVFTNPQSRDVAYLIGIKNIVPIEKVNENEVFVPFWKINIKTRIRVNEEHKYVGIRARDIIFADEIEDDKANYIPIEIIKVSHEFNFISVLCKVKNIDSTAIDTHNNKNIVVKIPRNRWDNKFKSMKYIKFHYSSVILLKQD